VVTWYDSIAACRSRNATTEGLYSRQREPRELFPFPFIQVSFRFRLLIGVFRSDQEGYVIPYVRSCISDSDVGCSSRVVIQLWSIDRTRVRKRIEQKNLSAFRTSGKTNTIGMRFKTRRGNRGDDGIRGWGRAGCVGWRTRLAEDI
jgi:hypothetical protein